MAIIDFEVHGQPGEIALRTYKRATDLAFGVLSDYDAGITGLRHGGLRWYIRTVEQRASAGIFLRVYSKETDLLKRRVSADPSVSVAGAFVGGFDDLENKMKTPPYLTELGMMKAQEMVGLIGKNGAVGFSVSVEDKRVEITEKTANNIRQLLPLKRTAIGSVEGTLEKISVHKDFNFVVYHSITKRAVTCQIREPEMMQLAKEALGKRVSVTGILYKNFQNETKRVSVQRMRIIGSGLIIVPGIDRHWEEPAFSDAEDSADLLRRIRGA